MGGLTGHMGDCKSQSHHGPDIFAALWVTPNHTTATPALVPAVSRRLERRAELASAQTTRSRSIKGLQPLSIVQTE